MDIPEITVADKRDAQQAVSTLVMGFAGDPLVRWFFPAAEAYLNSAGGLFSAFGGVDLETTTIFSSKQFEGVALWHPPGTHVDEDAIGEKLVTSVSPEIQDEVFAVFEQMERYHPEGDIWYLPLIAVDPAHQGSGLGAALMKEALKRCDEDGLPAYLESSNQRNISLYQRHGFEIMGEIQVGSSPIVTPMLRPVGG